MVRSRWGILLGVASSVACGGVDFDRHLGALQQMPSGVSIGNSITALDATGDGAVDGADVRVFDTIAKTAREAIFLKKLPTGIGVKLYEGTPKDLSPVFELLRSKDGDLDLSGVGDERLEELAIEAEWAAGQARLLALLPVPQEGEAAHSLEQPFGGSLNALLPGYNAAQMSPEMLCEAISAIDITQLREAGIRPAAIFDIDSTIWAGNITDVFLATLAELKVPLEDANLPLREFLKGIEGIDHAVVDANDVSMNAALLLENATDSTLPRSKRVSPKDQFLNIVGLLAGLDEATVNRAALHAMNEGAGTYPAWRHQVFADPEGCGTRKVVTLMQQRGIEVYLLSATLDLLARTGADMLGVPQDHVLASILEIKDGKYTGKVKDGTYYTKGFITRQWLPNPPILAFGDSPTSDYPMLREAAFAAFMVNARPRFIEVDATEILGRMVVVPYDITEAEIAAEHSDDQ